MMAVPQTGHRSGSPAGSGDRRTAAVTPAWCAASSPKSRRTRALSTDAASARGLRFATMGDADGHSLSVANERGRGRESFISAGSRLDCPARGVPAAREYTPAPIWRKTAGEHVVERARQLDHLLVVAIDRDRPAGLERLHVPHERGQPVQRRERATQQHQVFVRRIAVMPRRARPPLRARRNWTRTGVAASRRSRCRLRASCPGTPATGGTLARAVPRNARHPTRSRPSSPA